MSANIPKISPELRRQLEEINKEVSNWEPWQRSLDPEGLKAAYRELKQEFNKLGKP